MIKAVIFDLDGTLVNSLEDLADAGNYALKLFGFPTHETEKYKYFVGNGMMNLIYRILPEDSKTEEIINKVHTEFLKYYKIHSNDKTYVYDGVKELICSLKAKDIKVAVVTNKAHEPANEVIAATLPDTFNLVLGQRPEIPTKPDPTLTLMAMEKLVVKPQESIFIGDSGMDMATGVNSGALPVGVLWGFRTAEELLENGAKHLINSPLKLLDIIAEYDNK